MSSIVSDYDSSDSNLSKERDETYRLSFCNNDDSEIAPVELSSNVNVVNKLINRQVSITYSRRLGPFNRLSLFFLQLYGKFSKNPKAKTERIFNDIYYKCRFRLDQIIPVSHQTL